MGAPKPTSQFVWTPRCHPTPQVGSDPFFPSTPPDWPCSMGTDTSWITSVSPSSTTSSRASSTSTPPAKRQRPRSKTALVSHLPTALHHSCFSLSQSMSSSLSPPHGLLTASASHSQRQRSIVQRCPGNHGMALRGMVWCLFFRESPSPSFIGKEGNQ